MGWYYGFKPYVSVAKRRANAAKEVAKLAKKGRTITPVNIEGRAIASTFWGKAWCDHLESYSDFENRLPRGRTYVRNGSVVDLQIGPGKVTSMVSGSELYKITITIKALTKKTWDCLKGDCAGQIGSLVELLQGRLSKGVMELVIRRDGGLFPSPREIEMKCSCPDWAGMCKHVAATLYGVGARLDQQPELLFKLREVDHLELISQASVPSALGQSSSHGRQTIDTDALADVFGIDLDAPATNVGVTEAQETPAVAPTVEQARRARSGATEGSGRKKRKGTKLPERESAKASPVESAGAKPRRLRKEVAPPPRPRARRVKSAVAGSAVP
ncbi:MAG TPA: hypothetical protein VG269_13355 [Tepidisphaeraceae bacterium]|jgi:uncharacterized Zn finger protein|nr:hypothetical protein [Tepidisphaeraceae bacterium]